MKRIIYIILVIIVALGAVWFFNNKPEGGEVKIGVVLPLTGGAAFLGESSQNAALLALEDAGETAYDYKLIFEDDEFNPTQTVTAANKLINLDKVLAFITFGSGTSNAVAPINQEAQVVRFGLASDPVSVAGENNFIHWTPAYKEGELMASEIVDRGYNKVAMIDTNHSGAIAISNAIKDGLINTDVEIVLNEVTNVGDTDFRTIITKLRNTSPELVVLGLFSPEIELFARQMRETGVNIPVTSVEAFEWSAELELFEGMWFVSDSISNEFAAHYKNRYGDDPKPGASYVYDIVSLLIRTQENSNSKITAEDLSGIINSMGIHNSRFFGQVEIDAEGYFVTEASVKMIKDGKVVTVNNQEKLLD